MFGGNILDERKIANIRKKTIICDQFLQLSNVVYN